MVVAVFALVFVAVVLVMATLGAVLIARFVLGGGDISRRVIAAAIGGPLTVILPTLAFVFVDVGAIDTSGIIGFSILLVIAFGAIGWPISHFATRRLDRLTRFDPEVFE
jgi:hypothetical protein